MEIVPAEPADLPIIAGHMKRMKLDDERLEVGQFVVVRRDGRIVAFGRIKPYEGGVHELAGVGVLEDAREAGVGAAIVRELIRRFPCDEVYLTTNLPAYFERFGFRTTDTPPAPIAAKLAGICSSLRTGVVAMSLRRE